MSDANRRGALVVYVELVLAEFDELPCSVHSGDSFRVSFVWTVAGVNEKCLPGIPLTVVCSRIAKEPRLLCLPGGCWAS